MGQARRHATRKIRRRCCWTLKTRRRSGLHRSLYPNFSDCSLTRTLALPACAQFASLRAFVSLLWLDGGRISSQRSAGHAEMPELQARHSADRRHHDAQQQGISLRVVLGCFPSYISDSRHVRTPVSKDAWDRTPRNCVQNAAQTEWRFKGTACTIRTGML
jgi:hypothetical protein